MWENMLFLFFLIPIDGSTSLYFSFMYFCASVRHGRDKDSRCCSRMDSRTRHLSNNVRCFEKWLGEKHGLLIIIFGDTEGRVGVTVCTEIILPLL